jgi:hypothetical protein
VVLGMMPARPVALGFSNPRATRRRVSRLGEVEIGAVATMAGALEDVRW